jgi:hypothetical protein
MKRLYAGPRGAALRDAQSKLVSEINRTKWPRRTHEFLDQRGRVWRLKSLLELAVAERLDREDLAWWYERDTLLLSDGRRYTPDFRVDDWATYIEVKARPLGLDKVVQARADGHSVVTLYGQDAVEAFVAALRLEEA